MLTAIARGMERPGLERDREAGGGERRAEVEEKGGCARDDKIRKGHGKEEMGRQEKKGQDSFNVVVLSPRWPATLHSSGLRSRPTAGLCARRTPAYGGIAPARRYRPDAQPVCRAGSAVSSRADVALRSCGEDPDHRRQSHHGRRQPGEARPGHRKCSTEDARVYILSLTPKGKKLISRDFSRTCGGDHAALDPLSPKEQKKLSELCRESANRALSQSVYAEKGGARLQACSTHHSNCGSALADKGRKSVHAKSG